MEKTASGFQKERASTLVLRSWNADEISDVYGLPFPDLIFRAQLVHRRFHDPAEIQGCQLLSVKTGGCPEDCGYCPQSALYDTPEMREPLKDPADVFAAAARSKVEGATRFCIGAAWKNAPSGARFDRVLIMVRGIRSLGLEACATLGMLSREQADMLAAAGLTAYNHNLDTSPEYYAKVVSTRRYEDRLETLRHVRAAGISVCCGGIVGLGETREDRIGLLNELARQDPQPESVPINMLVKVKGTPLENAETVDLIEFVRTVATARIVLPLSKVRLSAGRNEMSEEAQALCFLAGANSIFLGERLLTTPNPGADRDGQMLERLGMRLSATEATAD